MTTDSIYIMMGIGFIIVLICLLSPNVCMWIHKKHFEWKVLPAPQEEKKETPLFTIEYYPLSNRYYPKCNDDYLTKDFTTGAVEIQPKRFFNYASHFKTEKYALEFIDLFKEHQLKEKVEVIPTNK